MKTIKIDLFSDGIDSLIKQLEEYDKSIDAKMAQFIEALTSVGIRKAESAVAEGTHQMPQLIRFEKEVEADGDYVLGMVIGTGETFISEWVDINGTEHMDEVYPLSMMEFGSALYALAPQEAFGGYGGRGTFSSSGNEMKAAWTVTKRDPDGTEHTVVATAIHPTQPMYKAANEMRDQMLHCVRQAFGNDTGGD